MRNSWIVGEFWDEHEEYFLKELVPQLITNPADWPKWEIEWVHEIRKELNPEDWKNLPELIREYRVEIRRQEIDARQRAERERQERVRHKKEKQILLKSLREHFERDFLMVNNFYQTQCTGHISREDYKAEKINYVRSWAADHLDISPDSEQAAAIGAIEGHVKVVARAGSGKTTTLVTRALFLQQHCGVAPDEMLLLAFNRKAAEEMRDRLTSYLQDSIPHVMTFHALAYALVHPEEILVDEPDGEQSQSRTLQDVIDRRLRDPNYYDEIRALMIAHFRDDWERIVSGGYDKTPKEMLRYRRSLPRESLDGKYVKSFGGEDYR